MRIPAAFILLGLLVFSAGPRAEAQPSPWRGVTQIVAHRGSSVDRPECTLAAIEHAIESGATAVEVDVRRTSDAALVILHDATLDRTTNGKGPVGDVTLAELKKLDAGSWHDAKYADQRVPTLAEVLKLCRGRIDVLLDLKEQGDDYDAAVVKQVKGLGEPQRIIVGVRSIEQAERFRKLLPQARQLGLIAQPDDIEAYAKAGVEMIRLWPRWLTDETLVPRVRKAGAKLHLNGTTGESDEIKPLLAYSPDSLSSDNPRRLVHTLSELKAIARTIVAFGDSTTAPRGKLAVYAGVLEKELNERGTMSRVVNAGVGGNTTAAARVRFERDVLAHKPDEVVIQFGINDSAVDVWKDPPATEPRVAIDKYEQNLRYFVGELKRRGAQPILMTPNPLSWTPALKSRYGKPPYRADDVDGFNVLLKKYADVVRKVAREEDVKLVDVYAAFEQFGRQDGHSVDELLLDGMHPNDAGQRIVADLLLEELAPPE